MYVYLYAYGMMVRKQGWLAGYVGLRRRRRRRRVSSFAMCVNLFKIFSQIYCQGPILEAVHRLHLFNDSKYFVDMSLKYDPGPLLLL